MFKIRKNIIYSKTSGKYLCCLRDQFEIRYTDFTLRNFLFQDVELTKNANPDKYSYSVYGIGFDARGSFSLSDGSGFVKNVIILGTDMSSSLHVEEKFNKNNKKKDILNLDKSPLDGLDNTTLTAEKDYFKFSE